MFKEYEIKIYDYLDNGKKFLAYDTKLIIKEENLQKFLKPYIDKYAIVKCKATKKVSVDKYSIIW